MAGVGGHLGKSEAKEKGWMRGSTIRTEGKIAAPWQLSLHCKWGSWLNKNICWICNGNDQPHFRRKSCATAKTQTKLFCNKRLGHPTEALCVQSSRKGHSTQNPSPVWSLLSPGLFTERRKGHLWFYILYLYLLYPLPRNHLSTNVVSVFKF